MTATGRPLVPHLGYIAALISSMTFSLNIVLASIAYQYGANVHSVNLLRPWVFLAMLATSLLLSRQGIYMPSRPRNICLLLGCLMCVEMYGLLAAIQFIPVALAILTFFTYPLLIAAAAHMLGRERLRPLQVVAMMVTFAGLALTLNASTEGTNLAGVGLAFMAACAIATVVYVSEHTMQNYDNRVVITWMMFSTAAILSLICVAGVPIHWPTATRGWVATISAAVLFAAATFLLFKAVKLIGPLRTAIIDNSSPVWGLLFGVLLLDESLNSTELTGAALVLLGIITVQLCAPKHTAN